MRLVVLASVAFACGRIDIDPVGTAGSALARDCTHNGAVYHSGETFAVGDGCNSCACTDGMLACTTNACADACTTCPDGATGAGPCDPSGGCPMGPICGSTGVCCGAGEQCVEGVCMCAGGPACTFPDSCGTATMLPVVGCGSVCCHGATCGV